MGWEWVSPPQPTRGLEEHHKLPQRGPFRQPSPTCRTAFPAQHLRPSGVLSCWPDGLELTPGFYPRDPASSTDCFGRLLKTYLFARYQCILSALGVLNDYALYKSTHSLTQSPDEKLSLLLSKRSRSLSLQRSLKTNVVHSRLLVEKKWVCSSTGLGSDPFTQPRQLSRYFCSSVAA